jgi:hypothetical protein
VQHKGKQQLVEPFDTSVFTNSKRVIDSSNFSYIRSHHGSEMIVLIAEVL